MINTLNTKGTKITAAILLAIAGVVIFILSQYFLSMRTPEVIYKGAGVTEIKMLSEYYPDIKGTAGDTEVYVMEGKKPGASMLILGGTHPNEPSGFMAAALIIENIIPEEGTLYVIPRTNNSAFTCTDPQEGAPMQYSIQTENGERWFRFGSRATNPVHQWPDPELYVHASSGNKLSGSETRNINRTYPGNPNGNFTEKVSYGITQMVIAENIDISVDLHEASPEYPTIDAIVAHEKAMPLASQALINMQIEGMSIGLEPSPVSLRGLTHRELGDATETYATLMETANPSQGRLRGRTSAELVVNGQDKFYVMAAKYGRLYVPFTEKGHPLHVRVARHVTGIAQLAIAYNEIGHDEGITLGNMPSYTDIAEGGLGSYMKHK